MIVKQSPRTSALARSLHGEEAAWGLPEQLAAAQVDSLRLLTWLNSVDGEKGRNRPKPLPRPGVEPEVDTETFGSGPVSLEEMAEWLAARNPNQEMSGLRLIRGGADG